MQLLEAEKAKVRREYERREGATEVKKKVEYSKQLNDTRIKVLQAQDEAVRAIQGDAQRRLGALAKNQASYGALLQSLLVEAMYKLENQQVKVRCRGDDSALVQGLLPQAATTFSQLFGKSAPHVEMDEGNVLPPAGGGTSSSASEEFDTCAGGVVVTSIDGRIVCSNTLDDRLKIAYGSNLPTIRGMLFGVPAATS